MDILFIIIVIYKTSRNLANRLFEEEWSRFIFVTVILFSFYVLNDVIMTISTRIIITIIMMILLNLNLRILTNSIKLLKAIFFILLLILLGALTHRLWIGTVTTIIFMIFMFFIRRYKTIQKFTIFLILPLSVMGFFLGLEILNAANLDFVSGLDPNQIFALYIDEQMLFGTGILLSWFYVWNLGVIIIFFPVGVLITLYKLVKSKNFEDNNQYLQCYYLILFVIPFSFLLPATFYSIVIFFPILIIFSIYGIISFKKYIASYSKILNWLLILILLNISTFYSFIKIEVSTKINLWYVYTFLVISIALFLFVLVVNKYKILKSRKISFDLLKIKKVIWIHLFIISILIFSITTIETNRAGTYSSPYPWRNRYLTDEEIGIINYFQNEEIDGLIFTTDVYIAERISGISLLPTFYGRSHIGKALWYSLINPNEVLENTVFDFEFSNFLDQRFFLFRPEYASSYYETFPLEVIRLQIILLNMTYQEDRVLLRSEYNVQYIISIKEPLLEDEINLILIQSLQQSELEPVFSTQHLLVWKIN